MPNRSEARKRRRPAAPSSKPAKVRWTPARVAKLLERLDEAYGGATCALRHRSPYELLVATILSAQCTDARVNQVTPELFRRYPTPEALAAARQEEVEALIRSTGFFRNKAKNLIGMARAVVERYGGEIPASVEELVTLPGVARKTANVVSGTAYGRAEGIVVDTHVKRIARRLGLSEDDDPVKIERGLMAVIPRDRWIDLSHQLIRHGREVCAARKPKCDVCPLADLCPSRGSGA